MRVKPKTIERFVKLVIMVISVTVSHWFPMEAIIVILIAIMFHLSDLKKKDLSPWQ